MRSLRTSGFFYLFMVVFVLLGITAPAQEKTPVYHRFPEAIGAQVGQVSGSGLAYHRWLGEIGIQIAGGVIYFPGDGSPFSGKELDYSLGIEVQKIVYGQDFAEWLSGNLYLFGGVLHYGYTAPPDYYYVPAAAVGAGFGTEIILFQHFSFPLEVGYAGFWEGTAQPLARQFRVNIILQAGFRYRYVVE